MIWIILGIAILFSLPLLLLALLVGLHLYLRWKYIDNIDRIFLEKPLFIIPRGQPDSTAEDVMLPTTDGLKLRGCYMNSTAPMRKGVILFGLEFGSNRWAAGPYSECLRDAGYDVFAYEPRNQGESDKQEGFEPLQWVTDREVGDCKAALDYLKKRSDAPPRFGLYGFSKGANAGLLVAAHDPAICCAATDGAFATYTVMVAYMRYWFAIYNSRYALHGLLNPWYYGRIAVVAMNHVGRANNVSYPSVERALQRFRRPFLMIHGGGDTYIKPVMTQTLFEFARPPKELWIVPEAKHNQALHVAPDEYKRKLVEFFDRNLA